MADIAFQSVRHLPARCLTRGEAVDSERVEKINYTLSVQLVAFSSYSLRSEWAENSDSRAIHSFTATSKQYPPIFRVMLKQQLQKELTEALKSGNQLKRLVLGSLMTAIKNRELAKRGQIGKITNDQRELEQKSQLGTEEILEIIAGEVKKRKDSVEQFTAGGRMDLAEKEKAEMEILMVYLPEQLSEEKVKNVIQLVIEELGATGPKEMGKVIGAVMTRLKGRADGTLVSKIVKELLPK